MFLIWRKYLHDRRGSLSHKTSLAPPFCIEVHVSSQDNVYGGVQHILCCVFYFVYLRLVSYA